MDLLISPGQAASPGSKTGKELKLCLEMDGRWGEGECGAGEAEIPDRWLCRNGRVAAERKPCRGTSLVARVKERGVTQREKIGVETVLPERYQS